MSRTITGRRNTEPNINSIFSDKTLGKAELKDRIDSEIMRVEDNIVKLVMQRALLKRRRNALSPAVNLPPEILAIIFEYACSPSNGGGGNGYGYGNGGEFECDRHYNIPGEGAGAGDAEGRGRRGLVGRTNLGVSVGAGAVTPLYIGTICSAWRHISQNTTQLWDTLTVSVCVNSTRAASQAALLRTWLKRSGQRPLTIKLLEDDGEENENENDNDNEEIGIQTDTGWGIDVASHSVIDALAAHSAQWHTIDTFLPSTWKPTLSKIKHAKNSFPLLVNATLRAAEACPTLPLVDAFVNAPSLREVRLVGYSVTDVLLPWAQLERLNGEYFSPGECLDTLHLGSKLRTCQFEQLYRGGVHPFAVRPIRHECLESFELIMDGTREHELEALFGALTLPNLRELVLSLCLDGEEEVSLLRPVVPLMQRSGFKLERLHLVGVTPEEDELIGFLKALPTLKALLLINPVTDTGGTLSQRFIDAMMPMDRGTSHSSLTEEEGGSDSYLTPMLEHLEYQGATSFTSQALTELLISRWRVGLEDNNTVPLTLTDARELGQQDQHQHQLQLSISELKPCTLDSIDPLTAPETAPLAALAPKPTSSLSDPETQQPLTPPPPPQHQHHPPRTQLHSVIITTTKKIKFNCADAQTVQSLIAQGMHLDFLADINGPFL